jgi:hypothetical protein
LLGTDDAKAVAVSPRASLLRLKLQAGHVCRVAEVCASTGVPGVHGRDNPVIECPVFRTDDPRAG